MSEHITTSRLQRFRVRALPVGELTSIAEHLDVCPSCNHQFTDMLRSQRGSEQLKITLAPEFWLRHEHVDFDQLVAIANNKVDETDREMIDIHLSTCPSCQEDLRSFLAFRQEIEPELRVRNTPPPPMRPRGRALAWIWSQSVFGNPVYAAAAVILIAVALAIAVIALRHRSGVLEASKNQTPQASPKPSLSGSGTEAVSSPAITPSVASNSPTPSRGPTPKKSGEHTAPQTQAIVALNDGRGTVTINRNGKIAGLDDL